MPFIAMIADPDRPDLGQRKVYIGDYSQPKRDLLGRNITCQVCGREMYVRHTLITTAHFAHKPGEDADCAYGSQPESDKHLAAKLAIQKWIKTNTAQYFACDVEMEFYMPDIGRIADVAVIYPDSSIEVHEAQLAAITQAELEERTNDYLRYGAQDVIWWLGGNADTANNREWTKRNFGYVATIDAAYTHG